MCLLLQNHSLNLFFFAVYQLGLGEHNLRILLAGEKKKEWRSSSKREGKKRKCNEYVHYSLFKVELREYFEFDTLHCTSQWESSDVFQTNSDATKYQKMTVSVFVSSWWVGVQLEATIYWTCIDLWLCIVSIVWC